MKEYLFIVGGQHLYFKTLEYLLAIAAEYAITHPQLMADAQIHKMERHPSTKFTPLNADCKINDGLFWINCRVRMKHYAILDLYDNLGIQFSAAKEYLETL